MRVTTKATYDVDGNLLEWEGFEYCGPVDRCDRQQSKQVAQQGMSQSAQDQKNAQTSFGSAQATNQKYNAGVQKFMASNPYTNPQYKTNLELGNAASAAGATGSTADQLTQTAGRTRSLNAGQTKAAAEEMDRQNARDRVTANAATENQLTDKGVQYNAEGLGMLNAGADSEAKLYGTGVAGASGNLGPAASAAQTPSFWDTMLPALIGGGSAVGAGFAQKANAPAAPAAGGGR